MEYFLDIFAFVALSLTLTFAIRVLAQGFNKSYFQAILILFVPFYVFYFIIAHYEGNKWLAAAMIVIPLPLFLFVYTTATNQLNSASF
jgi:hypothetical protein